jgi:hypothetical protein
MLIVQKLKLEEKKIQFAKKIHLQFRACRVRPLKGYLIYGRGVHVFEPDFQIYSQIARQFIEYWVPGCPSSHSKVGI